MLMLKAIYMIVTEIRKLNGSEFVNEMESTYNSIDELEELFKKSNDMKMYVDLQNWKYYNNHPDERIEITETRFSDNH